MHDGANLTSCHALVSIKIEPDGTYRSFAIPQTHPSKVGSPQKNPLLLVITIPSFDSSLSMQNHNPASSCILRDCLIMAVTFERFPFLPWELRKTIWEMAIQFASPAAHCLYPTLSGTSGPSVDIKNIPVILEPPLLRLQCRAGHAANGDPRYEYIQSPGRRTSYNEFFTHFIAAGLWTACKESKLVIQRHFQTLTWLAPDFDEAN